MVTAMMQHIANDPERCLKTKANLLKSRVKGNFHARFGSGSRGSDSPVDHNHLCPSDDRDSTDEENKTTFILTNIVPQAPTHNRQAWRLLEEYARKLVEQGNELYIIAGTAGKGGEGDNGKASSLASGKLTVLAALWKVILVLPVGTMV
jgi:endonuclease G